MPTDPTSTETVETTDTTTDTSAGAETPDWDGELTTLDAQPWWSSVPDPAKKHLQDVYERRSFYQDLAYSESAVADLEKQMSGLQESLGAEVAKYKGEAESWRTKHDEVVKERDTIKGEVEQTRATARDTEIRTGFPDIYAAFDEKRLTSGEDDPLVMFVRLTEEGIPDAKAAKMVRAAFDMPAPGATPATSEKPARRETKLPDDVDVMSRPTGDASRTTQRPKPETPEEARRRVQQSIEDEEKAKGY